MNLDLLVGFNNYFNRRIKYFSNIEDYERESSTLIERTFINFNPNDGVATEQIINWDSEETPDYLLVINENDNSIVSRWFIMEWKRERGGQYRASLRRDVIADHIDSIKGSPIFMERGPLGVNDKLVYAKEMNSFNQIKKSETLLKDETESAWIVGYLANSYVADDEDIVSISHPEDYPTAESLGIVLENPQAGFTGSGRIKAVLPNKLWARAYVKDFTTSDFKLIFEANAGIDSIDDSYYYNASAGSRSIGEALDRQQFLNVWSREIFSRNYKNEMLNNLKTTSHSGGDRELTDYENLSQIESGNVIIRDANTNKLYRVRVNGNSLNQSELPVTLGVAPNLYASWNEIVSSEEFRRESGLNYNIQGNPYSIFYQKKTLFLAFTEVSAPEQRYVKLSNTRNKLTDAPYDMFCMKFNEDNLSLAQQIAVKLGYGQNLYDIQILPYCPARYIIDATTLTQNNDYSPIQSKLGSIIIEVDRLYYCRKSSDSFNIEQSIQIPNRTDDIVLRKKLANELDMYRLTSPNYSSSFEFSVVRNGGVNGFRVDFTYRPISPYIHVAPLFGEMYGDVNDDARGLICGGDYSIDVISDAWQTYQIQNKNYENIFNTKIKSLDYQHQLGMTEGMIGLGTSVGKGIIGGAIAGGNPATMALGAATGLAKGITNLATSEAKYRDSRQVEISMYNYQLGNIQALPDTLTKVSAYNVNNKYFPLVEYYTATDEEVELLKKKFQYQSYLIMRIDTIENLESNSLITGDTFVKGQVIRLESLNEDDHLANEVYNEIYKGVYL